MTVSRLAAHEFAFYIAADSEVDGMPEWLASLSQYVAWIPGVAAALFVWWKARDIEQLKDELTRDRDLLKSTLEVANHERKTQFSAVNERRGEVFHELYRRIALFHRAFGLATAAYQSATSEEALASQAKRQGEDVSNSGNELITYFEQNRLWLTVELARDVEALIKLMSSSWRDFQDPDPSDGIAKKWRDVAKAMEEATDLRDSIEAGMREALGVTLGGIDVVLLENHSRRSTLVH